MAKKKPIKRVKFEETNDYRRNIQELVSHAFFPKNWHDLQAAFYTGALVNIDGTNGVIESIRKTGPSAFVVCLNMGTFGRADKKFYCS